MYVCTCTPKCMSFWLVFVFRSNKEGEKGNKRETNEEQRKYMYSYVSK